MSQLLFKKVFFDPIRLGQKRTTIRRWARPRVRAGGRAFCPGLGWLRIDAVEVVLLASLGEADARADGFASMRAMLEMLAVIYPEAAGEAGDGKQWFRVGFRLENDVGVGTD